MNDLDNGRRPKDIKDATKALAKATEDLENAQIVLAALNAKANALYQPIKESLVQEFISAQNLLNNGRSLFEFATARSNAASSLVDLYKTKVADLTAQLDAAKADSHAAQTALENALKTSSTKTLALNILDRQLRADLDLDQAAYEKLRKTAMDKGLKLVDVAQRILDVMDLLG